MRNKKVFAFILAVMMISSTFLGAMTVMAQQTEPYEKVNPKVTAVGLKIEEQVQVVEVGAKNPKVSYTLTLDQIQVYKDTNKKYGDYEKVDNVAGVNGKTLATVTFDAGEVTGLGTKKKDFVIYSDMLNAINALKFDRPGIYYWPIIKTVTDSGGNENSEFPNNNKSSVSSHGTALVIRVDENNGVLAEPVVSINVLDADKNPTGNKDALYEDSFTKAPGSLTIKNEVTGNQGSKDQYFKYEIEISGMTQYPGATLTPIGDNSVGTATQKYGEDFGTGFNNLAEVKIDENGKAKITVWLKDQETIEIPGIPQTSDVTYKITESKHDGYDVTNSHTDPENSSNTVEGTGDVVGSKPVKLNPQGSRVVFKNDKATSIPTGVIMTVAPAFAVILIGSIGVGIILAGKRGREEDEEEA